MGPGPSRAGLSDRGESRRLRSNRQPAPVVLFGSGLSTRRHTAFLSGGGALPLGRGSRTGRCEMRSGRRGPAIRFREVFDPPLKKEASGQKKGIVRFSAATCAAFRHFVGTIGAFEVSPPGNSALFLGHRLPETWDGGPRGLAAHGPMTSSRSWWVLPAAVEAKPGRPV